MLRKPLTGRVNKTSIESRGLPYEETLTELNRTKVETTFVNTTLNETIEKQQKIRDMKEVDCE